MFAFCVILPIKKGIAKKILGNRVFNCKLENSKVFIYDDEKKKMLAEKTIFEVAIIRSDTIKINNDKSMWLKTQ